MEVPVDPTSEEATMALPTWSIAVPICPGLSESCVTGLHVPSAVRVETRIEDAVRQTIDAAPPSLSAARTGWIASPVNEPTSTGSARSLMIVPDATSSSSPALQLTTAPPTEFVATSTPPPLATRTCAAVHSPPAGRLAVATGLPRVMDAQAAIAFPRSVHLDLRMAGDRADDDGSRPVAARRSHAGSHAQRRHGSPLPDRHRGSVGGEGDGGGGPLSNCGRP